MNHIEPGRVAHLSIRRLHPAGDDSENLANFFAAIADYEHLIIDLRDNVGGNLPMIQDLVGPHIDEIIDIRKYIFFNSENPDYLAPGLRLRDVLYPRFSIDNVYTVAELLAAGRVPYLHPTDAARLSHGFETGAFRFVPTDANPFAGRKWILIDGDTRSAAEIYAMAAQIAGFATIVGEQTRGDFGKAQSPLYFILPNSGITVSWESIYVTDSAGRKLHEHHVIPDYPNREGMDALDTVLAMINEIR
ncbi:MAG: S41 family peptidase, partial [Defluviitaleaceae bacterium]|nr:S41 family peptidase [Defluviitaleaceae bacterium]